MTTRKEHVIGLVFAGGCQFYALGATGLCDNDGNDLPGFGWRITHDEPEETGYYQAPFVIIGGAFISGGALGKLPDYVEYEIAEEEELEELPNDADIDEEQILRDAMYSDIQSMIETFIHSEDIDDEEM